MYDVFELSGVKLTHEQKEYFRKFDGAMQKMIARVLSEDTLLSMKEVIAKLSEKELYKIKRRNWNKKRFYD